MYQCMYVPVYDSYILLLLLHMCPRSGVLRHGAVLAYTQRFGAVLAYTQRFAPQYEAARSTVVT
jgi:hypothetical protein